MFEEAESLRNARNEKKPANPSDYMAVKEKVEKLVDHCSEYQQADNRKAVFQIINTILPFFALCGVMLYSVSTAYWLTLLLTIPASLFLVRIFIIQHDCGHGSFFTKRKWNNHVGRLMSVLTWTPYDFWRKTHNMHHTSSGNLDNRGFGAIETITVQEYDALPENLQFWYRVYRNPYVMLLLGTPFFILIVQRFPTAKPLPFYEVKKHVTFDQIWKSVFGLNAALLAFYGTLGLIFGFGAVLLTYIPIVIGTAIMGGWMFFIQHQFEDAYWEKQEGWDYKVAAVMGSSYYKLPPLFQWLTGNIGLHHIHHLNAKIPNYRLQECLNDNETLQTLNRITFIESFKYAHLALWDEDKAKMIYFGQQAT